MDTNDILAWRGGGDLLFRDGGKFINGAWRLIRAEEPVLTVSMTYRQALIELLKRAKTRILNEKDWNQTYFALDGSGDLVDVCDERATSWCAVGALDVYSDDRHLQSTAIRILEAKCGRTLTHFNDRATHQEVLALFDEVIKELESA